MNKVPYLVKLKIEIDVMVVDDCGEKSAIRTALTHAQDEYVARGPLEREASKDVCEIEVVPILSKSQLEKDFPRWIASRPWGDDDDGRTVEHFIPGPLRALAMVGNEPTTGTVSERVEGALDGSPG